MSEEVKEDVLRIVDDMEEKYKLAFAPKGPKRKRRSAHPKTGRRHPRCVKGDCGESPSMDAEEQIHGRDPTRTSSFVRAWDDKSKARITDERIGFLFWWLKLE